MKLRIKKCPKCNFDDFYISTTGNATCIINHEMNDLDGESSVGEWDFNGKMKTEIRCSNCHLSLKRYIIKDTEK